MSNYTDEKVVRSCERVRQSFRDQDTARFARQDIERASAQFSRGTASTAELTARLSQIRAEVSALPAPGALLAALDDLERRLRREQDARFSTSDQQVDQRELDAMLEMTTLGRAALKSRRERQQATAHEEPLSQEAIEMLRHSQLGRQALARRGLL